MGASESDMSSQQQVLNPRSSATVYGKISKSKSAGTATYYEIDSVQRDVEKQKKAARKTKRMDGSDADGEWSEGDNEEEVVRSDMATDEEGEENGIDDEEEEGGAEDQESEEENGFEEGDAEDETPRKIDYADYIMDNIDAELHHIMSKGIEPDVILRQKLRASSNHRDNILKQGEEFEDTSDMDEKTMSVPSSQRLTSDAGTVDTGLGSGSLADGYASSDMDILLAELPKHEETTTTTTDTDSELIRQILRQRLGHRPREFENEELDRQLDCKVEAAVEKLLLRLNDPNPVHSMTPDSRAESGTDKEQTPRSEESKPPSGSRTATSSRSSRSSSKKSVPPKKKKVPTATLR